MNPSGSAYSVVAHLRRLAAAGHAVLASMHQPRSAVWAMLDDVTLLADGRMLYTGPAGAMVPWFESLGNRESSVVDAAWYDVARQYLVIVLKGRAYHYCDLDRQTWTSFVDANSLGRFYTSVIRDNFDCRESEVPTYP